MTQPPNQPPIDPFASIDTGRTFVMPTPGARAAGTPTTGFGMDPRPVAPTWPLTWARPTPA